MPIVPFGQRDVAGAAELLDAIEAAGESAGSVTKCGRCRLDFIQDPSMAPSDSPKWSLCPPCRVRLLGDESRTNLRWARKV
jgi:hypothetical protein